ncbi:MAG TPA: hypothetical protein VEK35_05210 [Roseiarcus sp.]|nr:hypothetical protein [Roseiarcus sp.]
MTIVRRILLVALLTTPLQGVAYAERQSSWDGVWTGAVGKIDPSPISISIANDKVVSYTIGGAPLDIEYSRVTPTSISFGDHDHYFMKLKRTSDTTASGRVHGRIGYGLVSLTKQ